MIAVRRARASASAGALLMVLAVVTLVALNDPARAAGSVKGNFTSQAVIGPSCTSAVGLCTAGALTGGLKGTFEFSASSLIPSVDTPTTSVVLYTGDITIHAKDGDLLCKDAGAFRTTAEGAVSSVCVVTGGTGGLTGATGTIQFVGTFTTASGGSGGYQGSVVTA